MHSNLLALYMLYGNSEIYSGSSTIRNSCGTFLEITTLVYTFDTVTDATSDHDKYHIWWIVSPFKRAAAPSGVKTSAHDSKLQCEALERQGFTPEVISTMLNCQRTSWNKLYSVYIKRWRATHEKINAHHELTVTLVVTAPGPNDHSSFTARRSQLSHGEVTAQSQLSHSSVTARSQLSHGEVTAQSRHLQYDHGSVTARSQLNHGPGHGWLWPFWSPWAHSEQSWWPIFFSWEIVTPGSLTPYRLLCKMS